MNLILLDADECDAQGRACLDDRRAQHIRRVLAARPGDRLRVGQINGLMGSAEVIALTDRQVELRCWYDQPPPDKLPMTVIMALPRPKMLRRILRTAAELGIPELWLINTWKVEKSYWQASVLQDEAVDKEIRLALEQCGDTIYPQIR